jgi:hypothetical protein
MWRADWWPHRWWFDHPCVSSRPLRPKRFARPTLFNLKDFRRDGRLGPSGEGGEPMEANPPWPKVLAHPSTCLHEGCGRPRRETTAKAGRSNRIKLLRKYVGL